MISKSVLGGGAILDGILIAATKLMKWPGRLYYLWALLAIIWGVIILMQKTIK